MKRIYKMFALIFSIIGLASLEGCNYTDATIEGFVFVSKDAHETVESSSWELNTNDDIATLILLTNSDYYGYKDKKNNQVCHSFSDYNLVKGEETKYELHLHSNVNYYIYYFKCERNILSYKIEKPLYKFCSSFYFEYSLVQDGTTYQFDIYFTLI